LPDDDESLEQETKNRERAVTSETFYRTAVVNQTLRVYTEIYVNHRDNVKFQA
jgi:hypothetical protein